MTTEEIKEQLIADFQMFDDWMDRYDLVIEMGKALPPMDSEYKKAEYAIKGCQSNVWLHAFLKDGKMYFRSRQRCNYYQRADCLINKTL